jgi:translocation and assembly module TamA
MLELVGNAGYAHAQLDATVLADPAKHKAILRYAFDAGPRVTIGSIEVSGADGELAEAVRRRAGLQPGDTYSTKAVNEAQLAIYGIGRFSSVRVDVDRANIGTTVPVRITVSLTKPWEARAGVGAGVDSFQYQVRMRGALSHAGWPTPLTTLGAEYRPSLNATRENCAWYEVWNCELDQRHKLIGTIKQQDIFTRGLNGIVEGGLDYIALEAYTMEGARARVGLDLPLNLRRLRADIGWQFGYYNFVDIHPAVDQAALGVNRNERLGAFTQAVAIDYRDDPIEPRFGAYAEFRIAEGTAIAGGAYDYVQLTPDIRGYVPLGRVVFAARARLGAIKGDVPPTERYYAGGASSQRGFPERRLSPLANGVDADGNPVSVVIGGDQSFETGFEVRTHFSPFGFKLGVVAFVDGADVTSGGDGIDVGNLHWAIGFGIRPFYLPVGPFRIEVARRMNRTGTGEPSANERWNYIISVGEAF